MRLVRLSGGIASGNSAVCNLFKDIDMLVADSDLVPCDAFKKGSSGWKKVVAAFGEDNLLPNGEVDGQNLAKLYFLILPNAKLLIGYWLRIFPLVSFWKFLSSG